MTDHVEEAAKCVQEAETQSRVNAYQIAQINAALAVAHEIAALRQVLEGITSSVASTD